MKASLLDAVGSRARALRSERGTVLPFVALALIVILGMAAFAIDLSVGWMNQRRAQTAADAAALAGVQNLPTNPTAAQAAAQASVSKNLPGATATITTPYNGNSSEMAVTVTTTSPAFFSKIWGVSSLKESATAAAQVKTYKPAAFFADDTSCAGTGLFISNAQNVSVTGGMRSDGALTISGGTHGTFDATTYGGPNSCTYSPNSNFTFPANYPAVDSYAYSWPIDYAASPPTCTYSGTSFNLSGTIPSGVYCATGAITVSGNGTSGNVTLVASSISISSNSWHLTPYGGNLLFYQTGSGPMTVSGNNMTGGWIFAPNATVTVSGNNWSFTGFIEAKDIVVSGNNWSMTGNGPNILVSAALIL